MVTTTNLISYYKCDENAANTIVADSHGSNTGTSSTNTSNMFDASGKINSAFTLNGSTEYVDTNFSHTLSSGNPLSVSIWFKTSGTTRGDLFGTLREAGANDPILIMYTNVVSGKIGFQIKGDGGTQSSVSGSTTINDNAWHHALLVLTDTTQKIYLDGNATPELSTTANTGTVTITGEDFYFGASNVRGVASAHLNGTVDEVAVWSEELTATNASELYNSGNGLAYPFVTTVQVTKTGQARITVPTQKTETGTARIQVNNQEITKNGQSRIQINDIEEVYDGIARLEKSFTKTETGTSRLEILDNQKTSDGNASLKLRKQKTQTGQARIEIRQSIQKTGNAYISESRIKTSIGNARIEILDTEITKTGQARIEILDNEKTSIGNARIEILDTEITKTGNAFVAFLPKQITYTGNASLGLIDDFKPQIKAINLTKPTFRSAETFN